MTLNSILDFLSADIANAIAWTILHSLWQASLIALIMSFLIKKYANGSSTIRYKIAISALYFVLICATGTFLYYYQADQRLFVSSQIMTGGFGDLMMDSPGEINPWFLNSITDFFNSNYGFIANTWLLGAFFFALKFFGGLSFVQNLRSTSSLTTDNRLINIFNSLTNRLNITKKIDLLESNKVKTPMVMGFLKPIILVPAGIINQLEYNEVEAILAHELAHVLRNDFISNLVQSVVEILFYYHPAVWWISANIRSERENCCDDMAVNICGNAIDYAKTLIKVQEWQVNQVPSLAIPLSRNKKSLFNRISRILNQPQNKSQIREKLAATLLLCTAFIAFASSPSQGVKDINWNTLIEISSPEITGLTSEHPQLAILDLALDSIPEKPDTHERINVIKKTDSKEVELEIEDGEIKKLKVDGEEIPKEAYGEYEEEFGHYLDHKGNKYFFLGDKDHIGFFGGDDAKNPFLHLKELESLNLDSLLHRGSFPNLFFDGDSLNFAFPGKSMNKLYFNLDSINGQFDKQEWKELMDQYKSQMKDFSHSFKFENDGENYFWKGNPEFLWAIPEFGDSSLNENFEFHDLDELKNYFDYEQWEDLSENLPKGFEFNFEELPNHQNFEFYFPKGLEKEGFHFRSSSPADAVINELWEDGLLIEGQENEIELSGKNLKINGDKQAENIWKKYKKLYEDEAGHELSKKSKIELKVEGEKPKVRRRTIRI